MSAGTGTAGRERRLAAALLSLAGGEVAGKVLTLATLVLAARAVGIEGFGLLTFGMGLGTLLATLPSLAPSARMVQLVGRDLSTLGVRLAALTVLRWAFTVPAAALAVPFVLLRPEAADRWALALMVAAALLDNTLKVWLAACTALDRQAATAAVLVAQRLVTLLLVLGALTLHPTPVTVAAAFVLGALFANAAMARLARRFGARAAYRGLRREHFRELLAAVPVSGASSILEAGLARLDVILLGLLAGDAAVGVYGVAHRLMETALFVSWSLARALTPDLVRARDGAELGPPLRLGLVLLGALYVPYGAVLALAGDRLAALLFGSGYETGGVLALLAAAPLLFGIAHFSQVALFARRPDPLVPLALLLALTVNLGLNLVLLPHLAAEAAALAKTAAFGVQAAVLGLGLARLAPIPGLVRGAAVTVAAAACACLPLIAVLPRVPAVLLPVLALAGTVYCALWYLLCRRFDRETAAWIGRARAGAAGTGPIAASPASARTAGEVRR
ncbi:oligosaccharide flippase family protein [Brevibacterium album]|uniref:oligosaccharide flippase family protein n=1 Tax=Brevibacterium album TaxID=417948 RepID=UPI000415D76D|nr:oligosaccharide flippase family protein [Brevibacterium album]